MRTACSATAASDSFSLFASTRVSFSLSCCAVGTDTGTAEAFTGRAPCASSSTGSLEGDATATGTADGGAPAVARGGDAARGEEGEPKGPVAPAMRS